MLAQHLIYISWKSLAFAGKFSIVTDGIIAHSSHSFNYK